MNPRVLALLMRPAPGGGAVLALPVAAFGIVTALVLTVVGGAQTFWSWTDQDAGLYQALAAMALVLLVVPLLGLGGAAARLSARRRDERLSTLRLLGVSPGGVVAATVIESVAIAAVGALAGLIGYLALSPAIGAIPFRGEALGWGAVLLPPAAVAIVVGGVLLLAGASAVIGLRRVVISPLGVRTRADAPRAHWLRAVAAAVVVGIAVLGMQVFPGMAGMLVTIVVVAGLFAAGLAVLNLIGPWALSVQARMQLRRAERPERLLASRLVLESPKSAWRQVSGVAMASFMAVFAGTAVSLMDTMGASGDAGDAALVVDIRTGLIITLVGSFLMVASSVGVNQAAEILDQRSLHVSLHHLGMPLDTLERARRRAVMSPLLLTSLGSALCAAVLVFPLIGIALIVAPLSLLTIAAVIALGIGVVWLGTRVTRPLLARSFAEA
ncbi:FtsX-like permease family protein [Microbacterium abyssi]|uniref:FtsX-like permease family protein n=1 Tax=Microbacterium abyssi TaxID=2782166 RepID=UPI001886CE11|nr:FtsX-like permease family protein [Microbacterium sp. A18JL241]